MRRWEGGRTAPNCTFYWGGLNANIFGANFNKPGAKCLLAFRSNLCYANGAS